MKRAARSPPQQQQVSTRTTSRSERLGIGPRGGLPSVKRCSSPTEYDAAQPASGTRGQPSKAPRRVTVLSDRG